MVDPVRIGGKLVGPGQPVFIVAEIGINHNGDIELAKKLIDLAAETGCDGVKFQKRTPELCVPAEQRDIVRETPWGMMTYLEYRHRIEFGDDEYKVIDGYCRERGITWAVSCWDDESVDFIGRFNPLYYKVPSAALTDDGLLQHVRSKGKPVVLSTGMSTEDEIRHGLEVVGEKELVLLHSTSTYPCRPEELNLRMIQALQQEYNCPVGYSGHEVGLQTTLAAATLGACFIERHITLDRAMWGSDQAASLEPQGLKRLVRDIRVIESALGDGIKKVYESELKVMKRLRRT
jgi:N-acetylneuraminate synthase